MFQRLCISLFGSLQKPVVGFDNEILSYLFANVENVTDKEFKNIDISRSKPDELLTERGIDATIFDCIKDVPENRSKDNRFERLQLVRNMVNPEIGLHILKCAGW